MFVQIVFKHVLNIVPLETRKIFTTFVLVIILSGKNMGLAKYYVNVILGHELGRLRL